MANLLSVGLLLLVEVVALVVLYGVPKSVGHQSCGFATAATAAGLSAVAASRPGVLALLILYGKSAAIRL